MSIIPALCSVEYTALSTKWLEQRETIPVLYNFRWLVTGAFVPLLVGAAVLASTVMMQAKQKRLYITLKKRLLESLQLIVIAYGTHYPGRGWTLGFVLVSLDCRNENIIDSVSKTLNIYFSELWKLGGPRSRCQQIRCQVKASRIADSLLLVVYSHVREKDHLSPLSFCKNSTLVTCPPSWELPPQGRVTTPRLLLHTPAHWGSGL